MNVIILNDVVNFLKDMDRGTRSKVDRYIEVLRNFGYQIKMPYSRNILPKIYELRVGGTGNIRIIYTFYKDSSIVFYAFSKKTEQISLAEINTIKTKYNDLHI